MGKPSKTAESTKDEVNKSPSDTQKTAFDEVSAVQKDSASEHLPPLGFVFTIIACSGFLFMFSFRDAFATGRNIGGNVDAAYLQFTKSTMFFDDSHGWKSKAGGLSTISAVSTDANNMGGLFIRKLGGAACLALQLQKLMPVLIHPWNARWKQGHFRPVYWTAVVANALQCVFFATYLPDLAATGADYLIRIFMAVLQVEAICILYYLYESRDVKRGTAVIMTKGKTPASLPSRIVTRTVTICSGAVALIACRDLFFPGSILDFVPRDDIYLEWTNAFLHSPPEGTVEADENGMTSEMFIGDKFLSQFMALNLLLTCMYKFVSGYFIRYGSDGSGEVKAHMIWKAQFVGDALILLFFRLFSSAAMTASLDLRWHLMFIAYETGVLALYSFL